MCFHNRYVNRSLLMKILDHYPLITTPAMAACRDFYVRHFGAAVGFEASWFVYLQCALPDSQAAWSIAFMTPDHPTRPPGPDAFDGKGMIFTLQVEDAAAAHAELAASGVKIVYPLTQEPWGQRRFTCQDPAGTLLDIVEQTDSAPGYWDQYMQ
jgi:catechol 2,3-dioxygenase-like lactoylglutathione lyase family enzyme